MTATRRELAPDAPRGEYSTIAAMFDIRPQALVDSARQARKEAFVAFLHDAPILLIPVGSAGGAATPDDTLRDGLDACTARSGEPVLPSPDGLPFSTATVPGEGARRRSVLERMTSGVVYAVVLHKRPGSRTLSEHRICVGRSHGNDIVLRTASVSKLHAWFARDDTEQWFVVDAGSHNGTCVRKMRLQPKTAMPVGSGDVVLFGTVEVTFCTAADFWDVLAAGPP